MEAIEFQTMLGSDDVITIPPGIGKKVRRGKIRVIVIEEDSPFSDHDETGDSNLDRDRNYIDYLMANPIKVDKSRPFLTKDELYDRGL